LGLAGKGGGPTSSPSLVIQRRRNDFDGARTPRGPPHAPGSSSPHELFSLTRGDASPPSTATAPSASRTPRSS